MRNKPTDGLIIYRPTVGLSMSLRAERSHGVDDVIDDLFDLAVLGWPAEDPGREVGTAAHLAEGLSVDLAAASCRLTTPRARWLCGTCNRGSFPPVPGRD